MAQHMPAAITALFHDTDHLGPSRLTYFHDFLNHLRSQPDITAGDYYSYPDLDAALNTSG